MDKNVWNDQCFLKNKSNANYNKPNSRYRIVRLPLVKLQHMKKIFFAFFFLVAVAATAQDIKPADKGVVYGTAMTLKGTSVSVDDLKGKLKNDTYEGKVIGKVKEVCKAEGCWIKLERTDGTTVMVKVKDHSFAMPVGLEGKVVMVEGVASIKEVTEDQRKHYAEDAGKSKKEIDKIKGSEKDVQLTATSVMVLN